MTTAGAVPVIAGRWDHTRTGRLVLGGLWTDAALVMAASAWNGGRALHVLGDPFWSGVLLGLAVDVGLAVALVGDRALHLAGRTEPWGRALRVATAGMSLALNCAVPVWLGQPGLALFHAFLPVLLVLLSEYAQHSTLQFGEIAAGHQAALKAELEAQLAAERAAWQAQLDKPAIQPGMTPIPPSAAPTFRAVPLSPWSQPDADQAAPQAGPSSAVAGRFDPAPVGRPGFLPAVQPAGRPADQPAERPDPPARTDPLDRSAQTARHRTGPAPGAAPARRRTGKPKSDDQLMAAIRDMAGRNGGRAPSQYQLRQTLGIGGSRAARLLAELDTTPAGPPTGNGTATRKDRTP